MGKFQVTVGQYTAFLNTVAAADSYGLYNTSMATDLHIAGIARGGSSGGYMYSVIGSANHPVTYVSWGDAARFANWLTNGQPSGPEGPTTTETGAYTLNGATSAAALAVVTRNPGAIWVIPSENEWYKAAYYNPTNSSYYRYPTSSNTLQTSAPPSNTPNTGNVLSNSMAYALTGSMTLSNTQNYLTDVGAFTATFTPYGVFDMNDDVFQWNEAIVSANYS